MTRARKSGRQSLEDALAERLHLRRREAGFSQEELAKRLEVPRTTISNIEGRRQGITVPLLYGICRVFGINPADFLLSMDEYEQLNHRPIAIGNVELSVPPKLRLAILQKDKSQGDNI